MATRFRFLVLVLLSTLAPGVTVAAQDASGRLAPGAVEALAPVAGTSFRAVASGVSGAGDVVVGSVLPRDLFQLDGPPPEVHPFVWTAAGYDVIGAPDSLGWLTISAEAAVSASGAVVVGTMYFAPPDPGVSSPGNWAFRWTKSDGLRWLPTPDGASSKAYAASADGSVVIGRVSGPGSSREVRWSAGGEGAPLPPLDGGGSASARDVSADGGVVVGTSFASPNASFARTAFRWTPEAGSQPIPGLEDYSTSEATAISADGRVVVGYADGWWLRSADAVSADGAVLVGRGEAPDGAEAGWRARMPTE